jgi:serine/threonine protein phosphatase PrpC
MIPPREPRGRSSRPVSADIDVFGLTDRGRVRFENEDHFLIASLHKLLQVRQTSLEPDEFNQLVSETRGYIFLVADGVGGRPEGQRASGTVLRTIAEYVTHLTDLYRRLDPSQETAFLAELERSVRRSHQLLVTEGRRAHAGKGLATTLTMVAVLWPRAYLVQVGDSRCYRLRGGTLERMSEDQTVAHALRQAGVLSPEDAEASPLKHVLASALGGPEATPQTLATDARWDDVLLLCTDGLTKHVTDEEIERTLQEVKSAEGACRALVARTLDRGGTDNVTVVVGRLRARRGELDGAA